MRTKLTIQTLIDAALAKRIERVSPEYMQGRGQNARRIDRALREYLQIMESPGGGAGSPKNAARHG